MGLSFSLKGLQQSITLASIVFTLSFCLNLVAGKNLPYKGSPSTGTRTFFGEVQDTEDNNGKQKRDAKNDCPPETFWHRDKKKCVTWRCINLLCLQLENFAIEG